VWLPIAETSVGSMSLETIIQLASAGGFGALVWYFVVYVMPAKDKEHREERQKDQDRWERERKVEQEHWRNERQELLGYISSRDARWLEYCEKRDDQFEQQAKEWTAIMIRVETSLQLQDKAIRKGKPGGNVA
jgi:hypothetical protein